MYIFIRTANNLKIGHMKKYIKFNTVLSSEIKVENIYGDKLYIF